MDATKILVAGLVLLCTGCTVVPGSTMGRFNSMWFDDTPEEYVRAKTDIDYIPINATVLSNIKRQPKAEPTLNAQLEQEIANYEYRVQAGDILTVTVWEHPELTIPSGSFRSAAEGGNEVKSDGTIFFPYAGNIKVSGLTTMEIKRQLVEELRGFIRNPQVDVRVADFRSQRVYVSGAVMQPAVVPVTEVPMTLLDALESLGGLAPEASWSTIHLIRDGERREISLQDLYQDGDWTQNVLLQHGDLVHVPRNDADKIFVLGEVMQPQSVFLSRNGTTLTEALATARGIDENRADGRGIYVLRNAGIEEGEDGELLYTATVYHLNAASAVGFMLGDSFPLQPRDVVYVAPAPITRWNRFLSQLLPTILSVERSADIETLN